MGIWLDRYYAARFPFIKKMELGERRLKYETRYGSGRKKFRLEFY